MTPASFTSDNFLSRLLGAFKSGGEDGNQIEPRESDMTADHKSDNPRVQLDGVEHINIDWNAKTDLGKQLTSMAHTRFRHPRLGYFNSVEGFWAYIRSGGTDDNARRVHGMKAKRKAREYSGSKGKNFKYFHEYIFFANYYKIVQNPELKEAFLASTLPFDHYYVENGLVVFPDMVARVVKMFNDLRTAMQSGNLPPEPDYTELLDTINRNQLRSPSNGTVE